MNKRQMCQVRSRMLAHQDFIKGENAALNPMVTPTRHEVEGWLPMPLDVAGIVHDYLGNPFVTLWEVHDGGLIRLPLPEPTIDNAPWYDFVVDWGDGMKNHIRAYSDEDVSHTYSAAGQYRVHITGTIRGFCFGGNRVYGRINSINYSSRPTDVPIPVHASCEQLLCVSQWGCLRLLNYSRAFQGCSKLTVTARDAPLLEDAVDLSEMFIGCVSLQKEDFSNWQTDRVTNMRDVFNRCSQFNGNVSTWSTSRAKYMSGMFAGCRFFNGDLSHWKTGCVTDMSRMFSNCASFNGDLSRWLTGNVTTIEGMFSGCVTLQGGDLRSWDTSRVVDMRSAFFGCTVFNGDLSTWITGSVQEMERMFAGCSSFRGGDLRRWRTDRVSSMKEMFINCSTFEGDVSSWRTGTCENMANMFEGCCSFNGDLRRWDTSKVTDAWSMFFGCVSFNGDLSSWDMGSLFLRSGEDFGRLIDCICGGRDSAIPQEFRPCKRVNRLRSGKRWRE